MRRVAAQWSVDTSWIDASDTCDPKTDETLWLMNDFIIIIITINNNIDL